MNERLEAIKQSILASFRRTGVFYSAHRGLLLSGLTVLSILLIVWARFGFTLQFSQFFAYQGGGSECLRAGNTFCKNADVWEWQDDNGTCVSSLYEDCVAPKACVASGTTASCQAASTPTPTPGTAPTPTPTPAPGGGVCADNTNCSACAGVSQARKDCEGNNSSTRNGIGKNDGTESCGWWKSYGQNFCTTCPYLYRTAKAPKGAAAGDNSVATWASAGVSQQNLCQEKPDDCPSGWHAWSSSWCEQNGAAPPPAPAPSPTKTPTPSPSPTATTTASVSPSTTPDANLPPPGTMVGVCTGGAAPRITLRYNKLPPPGSGPVDSNGMNKTTVDATGHQISSVQLATFNPTDKGTYWEWTDTDVISGYSYSYRAKYSPSSGTNTVLINATLINCGGSPSETPSPTALPTPSPTITATAMPGPGYSISVSGRNATTAGLLANTVQLQTGQQVEVVIAVLNLQNTQNASSGVQSGNVVVRAVLPAGLEYVSGSTSVGGIPTTIDSIATGGLALGVLTTQQQTAVVFRARAVASQFVVGTTQTSIVVSATVANANQQTATLPVTVTRAAAGVPGAVKTGPGDAVLVALLVSAIMTLLYVSYSHTSAYKRKEIEAITQGRDPLDFRS